MVTALIFAGGTGLRMKSEKIPKQFLKVDGIPIIIRTLEHFERHEKVKNIVVVCIKSWIGELENYLEMYNLKKVSDIIPGGKTGYQSIHAGLLKAADYMKGDDIVLICDGVRPMLSETLLTTCIKEAGKYGTAVPVTESIDSVLYSEDGSNCKKNFSRKNMYITQAPQGYKLDVIMKAHDIAEERGIESVSSADLLLEIGEEVHIFKGLRENIKVTTPEDLEVLRATQYYRRFQDFAHEELMSGVKE